MSDENYLELDFRGISDPFDDRPPRVPQGPGRRDLHLSGPRRRRTAAPRRRAAAAAGQGLPTDFNAFLKIGEDGRVTCFTGKIEMGQGIITSLAQMLADELDVPLEQVDMVMGDTDLCPWDMGTFGSMSTRFFGPPLRAAAAEAKSVLLELAAERLQTAGRRSGGRKRRDLPPRGRRTSAFPMPSWPRERKSSGT